MKESPFRFASHLATDSFTPTTLVSRLDIERTPGADGTNSLAMITDYVPGAYVTHDMLHMRGGHQTTWLLDGHPHHQYRHRRKISARSSTQGHGLRRSQCGSYSAEFGDRTYGVFNVVPRTGFERNRQGRTHRHCRNFYQTDDDLSFGSHTDRFGLLRQRQWKSQQSRPAAARSPGCARRGQRLRRLRVVYLQCGSLQPTAP